LDGIVFYSLFLLPEDKTERDRVINFILKKEKTIYYAVEGLRMNNKTEHERIENILQVKKVLPNCLMKYDYKGNLEEFNNSQHSSGKTIEEIRLELVGKVGENVKIRRIQTLESDGKYIGHYMHGSKIGVAIILEKDNEELAKDICMHIAAMKPTALNTDDISQEDL
jgi:hypothetical protein